MGIRLLYALQALPSLEPCHLIANRPDYVVATWRQIFCAIWRRETTEDAVRRVHHACVEFAKQHPRGIGLLTVVEGEASLPPAGARKALASSSPRRARSSGAPPSSSKAQGSARRPCAAS